MTFATTHPIQTEGHLGKAKRFLKVWNSHRKDQRDFARLLKLSNRDLADMGVTRDGVRQQMKQPMVWNHRF